MNKRAIFLTSLISFMVGALSLYAIIRFYPDSLMKTITETKEIKEVSITDNGIADSVDKIIDSVVVVKTFSKGQKYATGTGFVYKKENGNAYILTNNHVIERGDEIEVEFTNGTQETVDVLGHDVYSDIAVLSLDASNIEHLATIGSSENIRVGDTVFTVGAPLNAETYAGTVTRGVISGKNRLVPVSLTNSTKQDIVMSVIQTDAAINSGNSGGPLVNTNGEVIGITSLKLAASGVEGMGFAIPIETAIKHATTLEKGQTIEYPYLGISMNNVQEAIYYHYEQLKNIDLKNGVYVESVADNTPAKKAGIEVGDIITEVDGKEVNNLAYLRYLLFNHNVGEQMTVKVYRNGEYKNYTILLDQKVT